MAACPECGARHWRVLSDKYLGSYHDPPRYVEVYETAECCVECGHTRTVQRGHAMSVAGKLERIMPVQLAVPAQG